ncbi:MAG: YceD family protein [Polyangia bacterium]
MALAPEKPLLCVSLEELRSGPRRLSGAIPLAWLAEELECCEYDAEPVDANVDITVEAVSDGVLVHGDAHVGIRAECGTCLAINRFDVHSVIHCYLLEEDGDDDAGSGGELTPDDLEKERFTGSSVVLDGLVRDGIMLELPINPRCPEPCRGPAAKWLKSPNDREEIDPRLAPLAEIGKTLEEN